MENLNWIDSITTPLKKWEKLSPKSKSMFSQQELLKHDENVREYCDMYEEIKAVHQGKRKVITQDDFEKKI
jgi:2-oxoglutarate/2-oxoacid ferredoxin oxidoreductase subunit beta